MAKILAVCHRAFKGVTPVAGADTFLYDLLQVLVSDGHEVHAVMLGQKEIKTVVVDGITVHLQRTAEIGVLARQADILITHLGGTAAALKARKLYSKPLVQLIHNTSEYTIGFLGAGCDLAVYNSDWISEHHFKNSQSALIKLWQSMNKAVVRKREQSLWPSIVVRPPTVGTYVGSATPGGEVTLVNLTPNKGPDVFYSLAEARPDLKFLGVMGGYEQDKHLIRDLQNVEIHPHTDDMDAVYARTSVLLVPSKYESYGRVAVEAMRFGIPVLASSTPGLKECLGKSGCCSDGDYLHGLELILNDYETYKARSKARFIELQAQSLADLQLFSSKIKELA